jgi:hypothetical protein
VEVAAWLVTNPVQWAPPKRRSDYTVTQSHIPEERDPQEHEQCLQSPYRSSSCSNQRTAFSILENLTVA